MVVLNVSVFVEWKQTEFILKFSFFLKKKSSLSKLLFCKREISFKRELTKTDLLSFIIFFSGWFLPKSILPLKIFCSLPKFTLALKLEGFLVRNKIWARSSEKDVGKLLKEELGFSLPFKNTFVKQMEGAISSLKETILNDFFLLPKFIFPRSFLP